MSTQLCGIRGLARQLAKPVEPLVSSQPGEALRVMGLSILIELTATVPLPAAWLAVVFG